MPFNSNQPDYDTDRIKESLDQIREDLNVLRGNENSNSFPNNPYEGQFSVRNDIENNSLHIYLNGSWIKLWSKDNGFSQEAINNVFDDSNVSFNADNLQEAIEKLNSAVNITFDDSNMNFTADNTQSALESLTASDIAFSNTGTQLPSITSQGAISDLNTNIDNRISDVFTDGVLQGGDVTENSTPNLNVIVNSLTGFNSNGSRINLTSNQTVDLSSYLPTTAGNEKYVSIYVDVIDLETNTEINIVEGTSASAGSATKPTIDSAQGVLLADVLLAEGQTTIINGDIDEVRKQKINLKNIAGQMDYVNVKDYGAKGDGVTDDRQAFSNALDYANENNKNVFIPSGTYYINDEIIIPKNVDIYGAGQEKTIITAENANGNFENGALFYAEGDIEKLPNLNNNITKPAFEVSFISEPNLKQGDIFIIFDPNISSYSTFRDSYYAGEYCKVRNIENNTVILDTPVFDEYNYNDVDIYKLNGTTSSFFDIKIIGVGEESNTDCIIIKKGVNNIIDNVIALNSQDKNIMIDRCYNTKINAQAEQYILPDSPYTHYGLQISNSQNLDITGFYTGARHGIAIGGADNICGVPNRMFNIHDCILKGIIDYGADIHGNSEYITYDNCLIYGGYSPAGNHNKLRNSTVIATKKANGTCYLGRELVGFDQTIENCDFISYGNPNIDGRHIFDIGGNSSPLNTDTKTGGTFKINNISIKAPNNENNALFGFKNRGYTGNDLNIKLNNINIDDVGLAENLTFIKSYEGASFNKVSVKNILSTNNNINYHIYKSSDQDILSKEDSITGEGTVTLDTSINLIQETIILPKKFHKIPFIEVSIYPENDSVMILSAYATNRSIDKFNLRIWRNDMNNFAQNKEINYTWKATISEF